MHTYIYYDIKQKITQKLKYLFKIPVEKDIPNSAKPYFCFTFISISKLILVKKHLNHGPF